MPHREEPAGVQELVHRQGSVQEREVASVSPAELVPVDFKVAADRVLAPAIRMALVGAWGKVGQVERVADPEARTDLVVQVAREAGRGVPTDQAALEEKVAGQEKWAASAAGPEKWVASEEWVAASAQ